MRTDHSSGQFRGAGATVLVVDDMEANRRLLQRLLLPEGYRVLTAEDGQTAVDLVRREMPDLVLTDVRMPGVDGFALCQMLKQTPATCLIPVVLMTGAGEDQDRFRAYEAGADDFLTKPVHPVELKARARSLVRLKRFTDDLDSAETVLRSLALLIEARDPTTDGHCHRLEQYALALGRQLGLGESDLSTLERGAYFHDIGKIAMPDDILLKPGPLTADEFALMKQHTVIGDRLCRELRVLRRVQPIVRSHHELLDGSGYPDGLVGDAVPLLAQIIGIVDVFDAVTHARPYKTAQPPEVAIACLRESVRLGQRSRTLVEAWIAVAEGMHARV